MAAVLVLFCLFANKPLLPRFNNILWNFEFKNEASRAILQENKRLLKWRPFWNKEYALLENFGFDFTRNSKLCCKWHNYFLTWRVRVAERGRPIFWRKIKKAWRHKNVQISLFDMCLPNYKSLFFMNAFSCEKRYPISMAFWHQADWQSKLPPFQGARPDHLWIERSSYCFPRELVRFVRPRELVSFDPWHATRSPSIGNNNGK